MKNSKIQFKLAFKLAFAMMLTSVLGIGLLTYVSYKESKAIFTQNSIELLNKNLEKYENSLRESVTSLKYNVTMLSFNQSVLGFLRAYHDPYKYDEVTNKTFQQYQKDLLNTFMLIMKQNSSYFQVRILDLKSAKELIKLVRKGNKIAVVPKRDLQYKKMSKYFLDILSAKDDIYMSDINLNREFNNIEFPIKPTLRVAKIIRYNGDKLGVLIINANVSKLFQFEALKNTKGVESYITNEDGDYILNTQEPDKEFGFEFGKNYNIQYDFPFIQTLYNDKNGSNSVLNYNDDFIVEAKKVQLFSDKFIVITRYISNSIFDTKKDSYFSTLLGYIVLILLFVFIVTLFTVKRFTKPITDLSHIANRIAKTKGEENIHIRISSKDEIGELANSFNTMLHALVDSKKEVESFASKLENEVEEKTKELQHLNENLQKSVDEQILEIRKKDQVLMQQAKMAAMGEMIGAIAHQWRQPLNALALNIQLLIDMAEDNKCSVDEVEDFVEKNMQTIRFMSNTIDDFRNFFREDKEKHNFNVKTAIEATLSMQKEQLNNHGIKVETYLEDVELYGFRNEFIQVILNLISNARDAIDENNIKDGKIIVEDKQVGDEVIITIKDNAGGVDESLLTRIFEPYFTTKEQGKGTGMGLYMSKEILEHMAGSIECSNTNEGALFTIKIPINGGEIEQNESSTSI